jgi:hypothetical protein
MPLLSSPFLLFFAEVICNSLHTLFLVCLNKQHVCTCHPHSLKSKLKLSNTVLFLGLLSACCELLMIQSTFCFLSASTLLLFAFPTLRSAFMALFASRVHYPTSKLRLSCCWACHCCHTVVRLQEFSGGRPSCLEQSGRGWRHDISL